MISITYVPKAIPFNWSSAICPIECTYDMPTEEGIIYNHNSEGYVSIWSGLFMDKDIPLVIGDLVFVKTGAYIGYHVVKKILSYGYTGLVKTSVFYQTETLYTVSTGTTLFDIKYASPPVWNIYAGYQDSEVVAPNPFPYKLVSEFQPEANRDGYIDFNISGYVQSALQVIEPQGYGTELPSILGIKVFRGADYNAYMPYRICTPVSFDKIYYALNSGMDSEVINSDFVDFQMLMENKVLFDCGTTFMSRVEGDSVLAYRFEGSATIPRSTFSDSFSNNFYK